MTARPLPTVRDRLGRPLRELRVSVTDRCNFRCTYCMPRDVFGRGHAFLPRAEILSFEEITRAVRVFRELGVRKVRLTGGEPLLRSELPKLVAMLAEIPELDLALTTNGALLAEHAAALANAGLKRVTVSLDSLDPDVFRRMSDTDVPVETVLRGIDAALSAGLAPVKVNAVVQRDVNDGGIADLARRFRGTAVTLRFIEYMDVGVTNGWNRRHVVAASEILERVHAVFPVEPVDGPHGVAERYRYADGGGEIGVIASVTRPFCGDCTRARLSADGRFFTCLFAARGTDLRPVLRSGAPDSAVLDTLRDVWKARRDRYSEERASGPERRRIEMSYIGG